MVGVYLLEEATGRPLQGPHDQKELGEESLAAVHHRGNDAVYHDSPLTLSQIVNLPGPQCPDKSMKSQVVTVSALTRMVAGKG